MTESEREEGRGTKRAESAGEYDAVERVGGRKEERASARWCALFFLLPFYRESDSGPRSPSEMEGGLLA